MASARTRTKTNDSLVTDILYAGLGAAALAKDEASTALVGLTKRSRSVRKGVGQRIDDWSEDLGELVEDALPEFVTEPVGRVVRDVEDRVVTTRKTALKRLRSTRKELAKRGERSWRNLSETLEGLSILLEDGIQPLLHGVGIASRKDMERIEDRLDQISAQLRRLEKGR